MHDINPDSHRHYLNEIERQAAPRKRDFQKPVAKGRPAMASLALTLAMLVLGGLAGGGLL